MMIKSSGELSRRNFLKLAGTGAATSIITATIDPKNAWANLENYGDRLYEDQVYASNSGKDWNLNKHFDEWMNSRDFKFPWPEHFEAAERIMPRRVENSEYYGVKAEKPCTYWVGLHMWPKEKVELEIHVAGNTNRLKSKPDIYRFEVKGPYEFLLDIDHIKGKRVYYQVFYRKGRGKFKPFAPVRVFNHPKNNYNPLIYIRADRQIFDDNFAPDKEEGRSALPIIDGISPKESGLNGDYFFDFFKKSMENPEWSKNADWTYKRNLRYLRNTFHDANAAVCIVKRGKLFDGIFDGGDDLGIGRYRYERQGLPKKDYRGNARKLWSRERKITSILTPFGPHPKATANHDGEESWNPARPHSIYWRKKLAPQPGEGESGSPDQNYFIIPLADGKVEFMFLDVVGYPKRCPRTPYDWIAGEEQDKWMTEKLKNSEAWYKFIKNHHVFGGAWKSSDDKSDSGYGRYLLYTVADYERNGFDPRKIYQVKITIRAQKYGVSGFFNSHDHIHKLRPNVAKNVHGKSMFALAVGTTNEVREEDEWRQRPTWRKEYGEWGNCEFLNGPVIEEFKIYTNAGVGELKTIVVSELDKRSNLRLLPFRIRMGTVVDHHILPL